MDAPVWLPPSIVGMLDGLSDVSITGWDRSMRLVYANATALRLIGRTMPEIAGAYVGDLIGEASFHAAAPHIDAALAGSPQSYRLRFDPVSGLHERNIDLYPVHDVHGTVSGLLSFARQAQPVERDITQRVLELSERKFRTLSDASPLGVYHTDASGSCTYTNRRWQEIYGMSLEESLGEGWSRALHPADRDEVFRRWQHSRTSGGTFALVYRVRRPDGSVRHVRSHARSLLDAEGQVAGFVGTVEDITEAQVAERRLRELYERTPAMMHSIDTQGVILNVSDRWLEKMGFERREEVVGRRGVEFFTEDWRGTREEELVQLWAQGRHTTGVRTLHRRDGTVLHIVASAIVQYDDEGQPLRALVVTDDVTELLRRTVELTREREQREGLERHAAALDALLTEREEMLDVLAHEVRQPLNNASAALQSAAETLADPRLRAGAAERLQRAQEVMRAVLSGVDNTLAVASLLGQRVSGGRSARLDTDVDIDTLLGVAVADMPPAERHRVRVERVTTTRTASMDMGLLRLALRNLLANALRCSPPDAPVTLRVWDSDSPLALVIDVVDRGPGIPPELLPRLFQRGTRGRDASGRPSYGLGLYIVRRVLELHGGRADLVETGPYGTTMRLWIAQSGAG